MKFISLVICFVLILSLAACSQARINENRMPSGGNQNGPKPPIDGEKNGGNDGSVPSADDLQSPEDGDDGGEAPPAGDLPGPAGSDYLELEGSTFEVTRVGRGTVRYTVNSTALYDGLEAAGISEDSYALSGERGYDYYIKISMTVENVDVSDTGTTELISSFDLASRSGAVLEYISPVWFSLGGETEKDAKRYFAFILPDAGKSIEIELAYGLDDDALDRAQASDGLWIINNISRSQIRLDGVL